MPRGPRQIEVETVYHIVNRGINGLNIFLKNKDYYRFILALEFFNNTEPFNFSQLASRGNLNTQTLLEKIRANKKEPIVELLAFCIMPSHYHLLIREIKQDGIVDFMRKLGSGYAGYFNRRYKRRGPLFESRYKAIQVNTNEQLCNAFVYIHTNPISLIEPKWKEQIIENADKALDYLKKYRWSSYWDYLGKANFPEVTKRSYLTKILGGSKQCEQNIEHWISSHHKN
jgi:putative transposase